MTGADSSVVEAVGIAGFISWGTGGCVLRVKPSVRRTGIRVSSVVAAISFRLAVRSGVRIRCARFVTAGRVTTRTAIFTTSVAVRYAVFRFAYVEGGRCEAVSVGFRVDILF